MNICSTNAMTALGMVSLNVEPAVTKLTYEVRIMDTSGLSGQSVELYDINTYGVKALFYINIDNAPKSKMFDGFNEGLLSGPYNFHGLNFY